MYKGGGVPDNDWNEPAPIWPKEPGNLQERIFREVALNLRKDIGLFQSALRNEMEAYVEKLVREVCHRGSQFRYTVIYPGAFPLLLGHVLICREQYHPTRTLFKCRVCSSMLLILNKHAQ